MTGMLDLDDLVLGWSVLLFFREISLSSFFDLLILYLLFFYLSFIIESL